MDSLGEDEIRRISSALVRTVHRAALLVDEDDYDGELRGLIRHARELHEILLCEQKRSKVSWVVDELRAVCDEMGASLNQFESLLTELRPSISE